MKTKTVQCVLLNKTVVEHLAAYGHRIKDAYEIPAAFSTVVVHYADGVTVTASGYLYGQAPDPTLTSSFQWPLTDPPPEGFEGSDGNKYTFQIQPDGVVQFIITGGTHDGAHFFNSRCLRGSPFWTGVIGFGDAARVTEIPTPTYEVPRVIPPELVIAHISISYQLGWIRI